MFLSTGIGQVVHSLTSDFRSSTAAMMIENVPFLGALATSVL